MASLLSLSWLLPSLKPSQEEVDAFAREIVSENGSQGRITPELRVEVALHLWVRRCWSLQSCKEGELATPFQPGGVVLYPRTDAVPEARPVAKRRRSSAPVISEIRLARG